MKILILALGLVSGSAFAALEDVELSDKCAAKLENEVLKSETDYLKANGEVVASEIKASAGIGYWPARPEVSISVKAEDELDGRYVHWVAKASKEDVRQCKNINLVRRTASACRFSRDEGPSSLEEIKGMTYKNGRDIKPGSRLNEIEEAQIRAFLDVDQRGTPIAEMIKSTDDGELSTATVTLPDGKVLDYYGAYGGDNPYGQFFLSGTTENAGSNGDGSICINYLK